MNYIGETERHTEIQSDIDYEKTWGWQDKLDRAINKEPWRLVDNCEAYIKKRMALEGLK
jgi:hypothetical protein